MELRTLISLASASALLLGLTACGSSTDNSDVAGDDTSAQLVEPGKLTVCSDVPYPPFEDFDKSAPSGFKGFDIDVLGFSEPYYDSEQSLLVAADSGITGIDGLAGKKVGVQKGTTGEAYANENVADADIVSFPSDAQMYAAIKAGQVDALLQDLPVNV